MFCGKCGIELREGAKFCHKCGAGVALEPEVIAEPIADTPTEPIQEVTPEVALVAEVQEPQTVPVEQPVKSVRVTKATQSGSSKQKPTVRLKAVASASVAKEIEPKQEKLPLPAKEETQNNFPDVKSYSQDEKPTGLPECGTVITRESEPKIELFIEQRQSPVEDIWMESMQKNALKATPVLELLATPVAPGVKALQSTETAYKPKSTTRVKTPTSAANKNTPKKEKQAKRARKTKIHSTKDSEVTVKAKRRKKRSKKKKLGVGILAIFVLILAVTLLGGKGYISRLVEPDNDSELEVSGNASGLEESSNVTELSEYYDGLVEANNAYGLSTAVTLDEAIEYYNEYLVEANDIQKGSEYETMLYLSGGITGKDDFIIVPFDNLGVTDYRFANPLSALASSSSIDWYIGFLIDNETTHIVNVSIYFDGEKMDSKNNAVSDEERASILDRFHAILYAMAGGDSGKATEWFDRLFDANGVWGNGLVVSQSDEGNGIGAFSCRCTTRDNYEK